MTPATLEFYSPKIKAPPFKRQLLCLMKDVAVDNDKVSQWLVLEYINDSEYGDVFSGHEYYMNKESIALYAVLPIGNLV